jgi:hypothetical protein
MIGDKEGTGNSSSQLIVESTFSTLVSRIVPRATWPLFGEIFLEQDMHGPSPHRRLWCLGRSVIQWEQYVPDRN